MKLRNNVDPEKKVYSRNMRNAPTQSESILWSYLRRKQLGVRFHRQSIIRGWIVDFYCPSSGLVVELDGAQFHDKVKDEHRDAVMQGIGLTVLRFPSSRVFTDINGVLDDIRYMV